MRVAAQVRLDKEQHPERYCPDPKCLWRVWGPLRPDTPCPKHMKAQFEAALKPSIPDATGDNS